MKKSKKFLALLIVFTVLSMILAGCTPPQQTTPQESQSTVPTTSQKTPNGETTQPVATPSFKFGFIHTSFSDQLGTMYKKYAEYSSQALGCEIVFAENGLDAELRMSALENMIETGCHGIIVTTVTEPMLTACKNAGVYLIQVGNDIGNPELKQIASQNPYFIGSVLVDNYEVGYSMAEALYKKGSRTIAYLTFPPGRATVLDDRAAGIKGFIDSHPDMQVATVYSGTDLAGGAEQVLASFPNIDGLMTVMHNMAIASHIYSLGLSGHVLYAGVDIQEGTRELLEEGSMAFVAGGAFPNAQICVAMLYNYLTGFELWEDRSSPIKRPLIELQSPQDYDEYMFYIEGDVPVYNAEEIQSICGVFNPDVTWSDVVKMALSSSLEDVKARRGSN